MATNKSCSNCAWKTSQKYCTCTVGCYNYSQYVPKQITCPHAATCACAGGAPICFEEYEDDSKCASYVEKENNNVQTSN